jgi:hypothetical protein
MGSHGMDPRHRFQWQSGGFGVRVIGDQVLEARRGGTRVNLAVRFNGPLASILGLLSSCALNVSGQDD